MSYGNSAPRYGDELRCSNSSTTSGEHMPVDAPSDDSPPRKVRLLRDVYEPCSFALNVSDLVTYEDVVKLKVLQDAMHKELAAIKKNDTLKLVELPPDKTIVGLK